MAKSGNNPQRPDPHYPLKLELQKLRKEGFADLAFRSDRYPVIFGIVQSKVAQMPDRDRPVERLQACKAVFRAAFAEFPSEGLQKAASILFHMDSSGTAPSMDTRRRRADMAFYGRDSARQPDTIQRYLEHRVLDPVLIEALHRLPPLTDRSARMLPAAAFVAQNTDAADPSEYTPGLIAIDTHNQPIATGDGVQPRPDPVAVRHKWLKVRGIR